MPPDLALSSTLNGSNYPSLELIFMVPKVFEPLKFDCITIILIFVSFHFAINTEINNKKRISHPILHAVSYIYKDLSEQYFGNFEQMQNEYEWTTGDKWAMRLAI